jgi:hypothetical protein
MENEIDKKIKKALDKPRELNVEQFTARVMNRIKEEKQKEAKVPLKWRLTLFLRSFFEPAPKRLARAALVATVVIAAVTLILIQFLAYDLDEATILSRAEKFDFGPPVPPGGEAATLLMKTDPKTILLTEEVHLISNDPLLRPHSLWEQNTI